MPNRELKAQRSKEAKLLLRRQIAGIVGFALVALDPMSGCVCPRPWIANLRVHPTLHDHGCWRHSLEQLSPIEKSSEPGANAREYKFIDAATCGGGRATGHQ